jgi:chromosomal replication initiator protein
MAAPNRFKLDWVKTQFASRITALACQYWEAPVEVQFVLDPRLSAPRKAVAPWCRRRTATAPRAATRG